MDFADDDTNWTCICCHKPILVDKGVSLDGTTEFHICRTCWAKVPVAVQVAECRAWRESTARSDCLRSFEKLCRAAMGSNMMYHLGRGDLPN